MRFDLHLRTGVIERVRAVAGQMGAWEHAPRLSPDDEEQVRRRIRGFDHTTHVRALRFAGVDGSGDFPCLTYSDSFVYLSVAASACYEADAVCGLREVDTQLTSIAEFTWLPGDEREAYRQWDSAFATLAGAPVVEVIERSDYRRLKAQISGRTSDVTALAKGLLRPKASDSGNVGIQLRSCAELGAAFRVLKGAVAPDVLAIDGTYSLPMVARDQHSLFHEHLKRLCATAARETAVAFVAVSKSHGLPGVEEIERIAAQVAGCSSGGAEHWYLRMPMPDEGWSLPLAEGRQLPPHGAVTYLVRFHRTTPVLRVDVDLEYWREHLQASSAEQRLFEHLDYAGHDQRCYGYPYPIKAGHDRASLTDKERVALRKQLIDAAAAAGMSRRLFRNPSVPTGHG